MTGRWVGAPKWGRSDQGGSPASGGTDGCTHWLVNTILKLNNSKSFALARIWIFPTFQQHSYVPSSRNLLNCRASATEWMAFHGQTALGNVPSTPHWAQKIEERLLIDKYDISWMWYTLKLALIHSAVMFVVWCSDVLPDWTAQYICILPLTRFK